MTKYEYLYFPDMPQGRECSGLYGDRVGSFFPKHQAVVEDLLRVDPKAVEKLARLVAEQDMDAVKVRVEVESPAGTGAEPPRLTGDFEKLLWSTLLDLIDNRRPQGRAAEGNCAVLAEPVKTVGNQRPEPVRLLDGPKARRRIAKGSARLTREVEMGDPSPTMAQTRDNHQKSHEEQHDDADLRENSLPKHQSKRTLIGKLFQRVIDIADGDAELQSLAVEESQKLLRIFARNDVRRVHGVGEAMEITGLSRARIKQLASEAGIGELISGRWMFSMKELLDYSESKKSPGRPASDSTSSRQVG